MADFDFARFGLGGIDSNFNFAFGNAFESRFFPEMGNYDHTRGVLIFGPRGCGKAYLAKQIAAILTPNKILSLNCAKMLQSPKTIEYKVNKLFESAEIEQNDKGDNSLLHVIILDDIDAIMTTINEENKALTFISNFIWDKVDKLNNTLIIGLSKKRDAIDASYFSMFRLGFSVEVTKPNEANRLTIISHILLQDIKSHTLISLEVETRLNDLAKMTNNFSVAEIEGLLRSAVAFAHMRESELELAEVRWMDITKALEKLTV